MERDFYKEKQDKGEWFQTESKFRLDITKKLFLVWVVRLPRAAVDAPSLEMFKDKLDGALSNLVQQKVALSMAVGLEVDDQGPLPTQMIL